MRITIRCPLHQNDHAVPQEASDISPCTDHEIGTAEGSKDGKETHISRNGKWQQTGGCQRRHDDMSDTHHRESKCPCQWHDNSQGQSHSIPKYHPTHDTTAGYKKQGGEDTARMPVLFVARLAECDEDDKQRWCDEGSLMQKLGKQHQWQNGCAYQRPLTYLYGSDTSKSWNLWGYHVLARTPADSCREQHNE